MSERQKALSEHIRRGYSNNEIEELFALAHLFLSIGSIHKAETILKGVVNIAPSYSAAFLGLSYVSIMKEDISEAIKHAETALVADTDSIEAILYLAALLMTSGDNARAGAFIGEAGEMLEKAQLKNASVRKFYNMQLTRYQANSNKLNLS